MKRFLFMAIAIMIAIPCIAGRLLTASPQKKSTFRAPEDNTLTWMQYCDYSTSTVVGVGTQSSSVTLRAVTHFRTSTLEKHSGKSISLLAFYANTTVKDVTAFIVKGNDINTAETVAEVNVNQLANGWNIIKLDNPVEIDASVRLGIGYKAKDNAAYPIAFDGKSVMANTSYLRINDNEYSVSDEAWGNLMTRALVDGDASALGYNMTLNNFDLPKNVPLGEPAKVTLSLTNSSFETITDFTYELTANGKTTTHEVKLDEPIPNNSAASYVFYTEPVTENTVYDIIITKVNGQPNIGAEKATKNAIPYDASDTVDRYVLIEKFTGQNCGYCPGGEISIANAIVGMEDRIVRIDHHYGYTKDIFTIEESEKIGNHFNVNSAPNCMMNRTLQDERENIKNGNGVVFHPSYITSEMVRNEISRPAFVTVRIESSYDEQNNMATIKVSGKTTRDMSGTRINVCITQSGYEAYQNSADSNWRHNDFPIDYMTDYSGDEIQWNEDGSYEYTYNYVINEKYGRVKSDVNQMDVVAYVSKWSDDDNEVMNAACVKLTKEQVSVAEINTENVNFKISNGSITVNDSIEGVEVYTVSGVRVNNQSLAPGIYIARMIAGSNVSTAKINIR